MLQFTVQKEFMSYFSRVSYAPRNITNRISLQSSSLEASDLHLSKKCCFTLPFDPDVPMDAYLCAVGDLVGDVNMVFAGKNNDVVKFYLCNKSLVLKLYENHPQVMINSKSFTVNKLVNNGHKISLRNVEPGIPNSFLVDELSKVTKVVTQMKFVNMGSRNECFKHLIGYRRAVAVESIENLPSSLTINHDNFTHKIFVEIDRITCFRCNAVSHMRVDCPFQDNCVSNPVDDPNELASSRTLAVLSAVQPVFSFEEEVSMIVSNSEERSISPSTVMNKSSSQAPPAVNVESCVSLPEGDNIYLPLTPFVGKYVSTTNPSEFINFLNMLRKSYTKLQLLTEYECPPSMIISVLTGMIDDDELTSSCPQNIVNSLSVLRDSVNYIDSRFKSHFKKISTPKTPFSSKK